MCSNSISASCISAVTVRLNSGPSTRPPSSAPPTTLQASRARDRPDAIPSRPASHLVAQFILQAPRRIAIRSLRRVRLIPSCGVVTCSAPRAGASPGAFIHRARPTRPAAATAALSPTSHAPTALFFHLTGCCLEARRLGYHRHYVWPEPYARRHTNQQWLRRTAARLVPGSRCACPGQQWRRRRHVHVEPEPESDCE